MRYVSRNIDLEPENGKQLQVTIIKISESKESNSIHGLDVDRSTGPGGQLPPLPPASYGSVTVTVKVTVNVAAKIVAFTPKH